jgi:hypothetical protein
LDSVSPDRFLLEAVVFYFGEERGLVAHVDFGVFGFGPEIHGEAKANLILLGEFLLGRGIFKTELKVGFVHQVLEFFLYIFHHFGFFSGPLSCEFDVKFVLTLLV